MRLYSIQCRGVENHQSLNITNLYSNIPVLETKTVLKNTLEYTRQTHKHKRTYKVVLCHHQAELLHPQPRRNIPTGWPCNGWPFFRPDGRILLTTHRKCTPSVPSTQTQNYWLLQVCRWHPPDLWRQPLWHPVHPKTLQRITPEPTLRIRNRKRQHHKLPGHFHS